MSEESEPQKKPLTKKWADCGQCGGRRRCDIKGRFVTTDNDEFMDWSKEWYILQCRGCEFVFCQTVSTDSESYRYIGINGDQVEYDETIVYWPALSKRPRPAWMLDSGINAGTTRRLDAVLLELYQALDNDLHILAAIGLRTSFDVASEILGVEAGTFKDKLEGLVNAGHIAKVDRDRLEVLVEAGNASAHRGWNPEAADLHTMMEALEYFLEQSFVAPDRRNKLDAKTTEVKERVPVRKYVNKNKNES